MTDGIDTDAPASEQFDLSHGAAFEATVETLAEVARELELHDAANPDAMGDEDLADMVAALKRLENAAEAARKDHAEAALDDRVDVGQSVGPVQRLSGSSSYVTDAEGAFAAVADAGADPLAVADVKVGALRDVLGSRADEFVSQSEYSYYRREG